MYEQNNKRGAVAMDREREHGLLYTLLKASSVSLCLLGSPIYICSYKIFGCLIHIRRIPRKQIKKSDFKCQCKKIPTYFEHKKSSNQLQEMELNYGDETKDLIPGEKKMHWTLAMLS